MYALAQELKERVRNVDRQHLEEKGTLIQFFFCFFFALLSSAGDLPLIKEDFSGS